MLTQPECNKALQRFAGLLYAIILEAIITNGIIAVAEERAIPIVPAAEKLAFSGSFCATVHGFHLAGR